MNEKTPKASQMKRRDSRNCTCSRSSLLETTATRAIFSGGGEHREAGFSHRAFDSLALLSERHGRSDRTTTTTSARIIIVHLSGSRLVDLRFLVHATEIWGDSLFGPCKFGVISLWPIKFYFGRAWPLQNPSQS